MKKKLAAILLSFILVGILLFTNHLGIAIRLTNWIYYVLVLITIWKLYAKKN